MSLIIMPYRDEVFAQDHYYHAYNRGAGKQKIFLNDGNYAYLLRLVRQYCGQYGVTVIAYCLMPNHYHFLLRQETELPLSRFMQVLFNAYVQGLNLQQDRTGTLFEGRFKHKRVEKWEHLIILCRYIHLNPVKAGLVKAPVDWAYSDYRDWIGLRRSSLIDTNFVQDHFGNAEDYIKFVSAAEDEKKSVEKIKRYLFD